VTLKPTDGASITHWIRRMTIINSDLRKEWFTNTTTNWLIITPASEKGIFKDSLTPTQQLRES